MPAFSPLMPSNPNGVREYGTPVPYTVQKVQRLIQKLKGVVPVWETRPFLWFWSRRHVFCELELHGDSAVYVKCYRPEDHYWDQMVEFSLSGLFLRAWRYGKVPVPQTDAVEAEVVRQHVVRLVDLAFEQQCPGETVSEIFLDVVVRRLQFHLYRHFGSLIPNMTLEDVQLILTPPRRFDPVNAEYPFLADVRFLRKHCRIHLHGGECLNEFWATPVKDTWETEVSDAVEQVWQELLVGMKASKWGRPGE